LFVVALVFVWRSFYAMRIPDLSEESLAHPGERAGSQRQSAATGLASQSNGGANRSKDKGFYSVF